MDTLREHGSPTLPPSSSFPSAPLSGPAQQDLVLKPAGDDLPVKSALRIHGKQYARKKARAREASCAPPQDTRPRLRYSPTSATDSLASDLVCSIKAFSLDATTVAFAPARLGQDPLLNTTASILVQLRRQWFSEQSTPGSHTAALLKDYAKAPGLVRTTVVSPGAGQRDETILAITVLGTIDSLMRLHDPTWTSSFKHFSGKGALLAARPPQRHHSLATRAMLYAGGLHAFTIPCFIGTVSPFEATHWLEADPASLQAHPPPELMRLYKLSHQLFCRLPRLVQAVKMSRQSADTSWAGVTRDEQTLQLAQELLDVEDRVAENWLLHRVSIQATPGAGDRVIVPFSFVFQSLEELEAGLRYWQTRVLTIHLYSLILSSPVLQHVKLPLPPISAADLTSEAHRLSKNILMACQYAGSYRPGGATSLATAILVAWTFFRQRPLYRDDLPTSVLGAWLAKKLNQAFAGWSVPPTIKALDEGSDVLEGGLLGPIVIELLKG